MAKNDDNMLEREKGGSRVVTVLIALAIVAIWLIIFACLIKFDVGGIGSKVLYPALKDVPVVNRICRHHPRRSRHGKVTMSIIH